MRAALVIAGIALALPAVAFERASQGSLLKPAPPSKPPAVVTSSIRLFGTSGKKDGPPAIPALVATPALRLWSAAAGGNVVTAKLVLLGPITLAPTIHTTDPIRLWGSP